MRAALFGLACWLVASGASAQSLSPPVSGGTIRAHYDHGAGSAVSDYACGSATYDGHTGTDYAAAAGTAVFASADGWVVRSEQGHPNNDSADLPEGYLSGDLPANCGAGTYADAPGGGYGNHVVVLHPNGVATLYGHLQGAQAAWGSPVRCGDRIGNVGLSGCTTGYHVHFEVRGDVVTSAQDFCSNTQGPGGTKVDPFQGDCNGEEDIELGSSCSSASEEELAELGEVCGGWSADQMRFLHETLEDGTVLDPDLTPTVPKTWTLQNSGTTTWDPTAGYALRFVGDEPGSCSTPSADRLGAAEVVELPSSVAPGEEVTLGVTLQVPDAERTYRGAWRMYNGSEYFGSCIWFDVSVGGDEPRAGCQSATLGAMVRDGDFVQASNGGCGWCSWQRCSNGGWQCANVDDVEPHRTAYATCDVEAIDPPPPPGTPKYPPLPKADTPPKREAASCHSSLHGSIASGHCVQTSYAACGSSGCGARRCVDGVWQCPQSDDACVTSYESPACESCDDCDHGECEAGEPLPKATNACTSAVCAVSPECCSEEWDSKCVALAKKTRGACRGVCYDGKSSCAHSECEEGAKLSPKCSTCAKSVCEKDPYCCESEWDGICATISAKRDPFCSCS